MSVDLPEDLLRLVRAAIESGLFASESELIAVAIRDYLRRKDAPSSQPQTITAVDANVWQRRLVESGVLSEEKLPITDLSPYRDRHPVSIQGEPLSETIIRERR